MIDRELKTNITSLKGGGVKASDKSNVTRSVIMTVGRLNPIKSTTDLDPHVSQTAIPRHNQQEDHSGQV